MSGRGRSISRMKVASLNYRLPQDETSGKKNRRRFPEPAPREEDGLPGAVGVHFASRLGGGGREGRAAQQAVRVDIAAGLLHHRRPARGRGRQGMEDDPGPGGVEETRALRQVGYGPAGGLRGGGREDEDEDGGDTAEEALHGMPLLPAARGRGHPDRGGAALEEEWHRRRKEGNHLRAPVPPGAILDPEWHAWRNPPSPAGSWSPPWSSGCSSSSTSRCSAG